MCNYGPIDGVVTVCIVMMSCLGSLARPLPLGAGFVMTDILMPQAHTSWLPVTSDTTQVRETAVQGTHS